MAGTKEEIPLLKWLKKGMRGFGALYLLLLNTKALFISCLGGCLVKKYRHKTIFHC